MNTKTPAQNPAGTHIDPVALAQALIQQPSVTPNPANSLQLIINSLSPLGFSHNLLHFGQNKPDPAHNLVASLGQGNPHLCFVGHVDVVPPGDLNSWTHPPFNAAIQNNVLHGRGVVDMKGAVASFIAAVSLFLQQPMPAGRLSILLTSDEEGPGTHGIRLVLPWMEQNQLLPITDALIGEPTNPQSLGDAVKIGRRGSLSGSLTIIGKQGHSAYPHLAKNPVPILASLITQLEGELDDGAPPFQPSTCVFSSVNVDNTAHNVIPERAHAQFNIRFNTSWTPASLKTLLTDKLDALDAAYELSIQRPSDAFFCPPAKLAHIVADAVAKHCRKTPEFSVLGGTSDGRWLKNYTNVVEFGLVGASMHQVNEQCPVQDLITLSNVYLDVLRSYFTS